MTRGAAPAWLGGAGRRLNDEPTLLSHRRREPGLEFGYGSALSVAMFVTEAALAVGFGYFIVSRMRRDHG